MKLPRAVALLEAVTLGAPSPVELAERDLARAVVALRLARGDVQGERRQHLETLVARATRPVAAR